MVEISKSVDVHFYMSSIDEIVKATSRSAFDVILLCLASLDNIKKEYTNDLASHIDILKRLENGETQGSNEAKAWQKECIASLQSIGVRIDGVKQMLLDGALKQIENWMVLSNKLKTIIESEASKMQHLGEN